MRIAQLEISRVTRPQEEAKGNDNHLSRWPDVLAGLWENNYQRMGLEMPKIAEGEIVLGKS
jgi:hypothetical protein